MSKTLLTSHVSWTKARKNSSHEFLGVRDENNPCRLFRRWLGNLKISEIKKNKTERNLAEIRSGEMGWMRKQRGSSKVETRSSGQAAAAFRVQQCCQAALWTNASYLYLPHCQAMVCDHCRNKGFHDHDHDFSWATVTRQHVFQKNRDHNIWHFRGNLMQFWGLVATPGCRRCPDELAAGVRGASSPALWTQSCGEFELNTIGSDR